MHVPQDTSIYWILFSLNVFYMLLLLSVFLCVIFMHFLWIIYYHLFIISCPDSPDYRTIRKMYKREIQIDKDNSGAEKSHKNTYQKSFLGHTSHCT